MLFTNKQKNTFAKDPAVVNFEGTYYMYYSTCDAQGKFNVGIAVSEDMENWKDIAELTLDMECEANGTAAPGAIVLDNKVHLFYQTYGNGKRDSICHAVSEDGIHFVKNPKNPVYRPTADWCCGRAIDADVCVLNGKLFMYIATRDHAFEIQKIGGAWAELDSDFGRDAWHQIAPGSLVAPEFLWEQQCIEAPATIVNKGQMFMFYGGAYNCMPQQVGCAVSDDGCFFRKLFVEEPFLKPGAPGSWNSSESGHPYAFRDEDGRAYLFYQGSPDMGKTWYLSKVEIDWDENNIPYVVSEIVTDQV